MVDFNRKYFLLEGIQDMVQKFDKAWRRTCLHKDIKVTTIDYGIIIIEGKLTEIEARILGAELDEIFL